MLCDTSCTVYKYNGLGYERYVIESCHWQENKASNVIKSGMQNADGLTVYIPLNCIILAPCKIAPSIYLLPGAETTPSQATKDIIVKGECNFTFDNTSQQSVSESIKMLKSQCDVFTVMSIDRKLYGSENLQHVKISAR